MTFEPVDIVFVCLSLLVFDPLELDLIVSVPELSYLLYLLWKGYTSPKGRTAWSVDSRLDLTGAVLRTQRYKCV